MKNPNSTARLAILVALVSMLGACATRPIDQPTVYTGEVHNLVARAPQVGDTGTAGRAQFVYTPRGWVQL